MKQALLKGNLFKLTCIPLIITLVIMVYHFDHAIISALSFSYYLLFVLVYLLFSKLGTFQFGLKKVKPHFSLFQWVARIIGCEIILLIIFTSLSMSLFNYTPETLQQKVNSIDAFQLMFKTMTVDWGLYPLTLYAIVSISLGYFYHRQDESGLFSNTLCSTFLPDIAKPLLLPAADFLIRLSNIYIIALIICFITLQSVFLLNTLFHLDNITNFTYLALLLAFIVYWISIMKRSQQFIIRLTHRKRPLAIIFIGITITMILILFIFNWVLQVFVKARWGVSLTHPPQVSAFDHLAWERDLRIFLWFSLLAATPFVSSYLIRISEGRSIRQFILVLFSLPIVFGLFYVFGSQIFESTYGMIRHALQTTPWLHWFFQVLFPVLSLFFLWLFFYRPRDYVRLDHGMVSLTSKLTISRPGKTMNHLFQLVATLLAIAMIGWLLILPTLSVIILSPLIIIFGFAFYSFCFSVCNEL